MGSGIVVGTDLILAQEGGGGGAAQWFSGSGWRSAACHPRIGPREKEGYTYKRVTLIYVGTRNVTFNLPLELMREAKIYAAEHDTTVNALVRELLQEKVNAEARARAAAERFLQLAARGPHSPVDPGSIPREELHERQGVA